MPDLIIDFENHLNHGKVFLVELETEWQDAPDEAPNSIDIHMYVIAQNFWQAQYIASTMYPDVRSIAVHEEPVTPEEYATRRNRSLL